MRNQLPKLCLSKTKKIGRFPVYAENFHPHPPITNWVFVFSLAFRPSSIIFWLQWIIFMQKKSLKAQKTLFLSRKKLFYFHVNSMHKCSKKVFKKRGNFSIDRELSLKEDEICDMIYCYIGLGKYNKMWLKCKLNSYNYSLCAIINYV